MLQLVRPHSESALAIGERLVSKPELLWCHWGHHLLKSSCQSTALQVHQLPSLPRPIGARRGRECCHQELSHVISSSLHVMHAVHVVGAQQQAAGAPIAP